MIAEVELEKKFRVKIKKDEETGKVLDIVKVKSKKRSKKKTLSEKRKEKKIRKEKESNNFKDFNHLKDELKFGEVVHRPPDFSSLKKSKDKTQKKTNYSSLLLQNIAGEGKKLDTVNKNHQKTIFDKAKAEKERQFIVNAYRIAKAAKAQGKKK